MVEVLAIAVPVAVTGVVGYIHLWVKTATTQEHVKGLRELIEARFDASDEQQAYHNIEVSRRLDRIERSMNGHLKDE